MSPVRALSLSVIVVLATSIAVVGPGLVGATAAGNLAAAGNTSTATPSGGTNASDGTIPADENSTTDGNASTGGNSTADRNSTATRNTAAREQSFEPGADRRPKDRPSGPRIVPDVIVDDDGKAHYRTLAAAVENARENETILVYPGTYGGGVRVDVDGLTIAGIGPEETELAGKGTGIGIVVAASDVTVRSVGIYGYRTGVAVEADDESETENVELADLTIERVSGDGVRIGTDGSAERVSNVTIESSEFRLGGVVGWSGEDASSGGNGSMVGEKGDGTVARESGNGSVTADNASGADDGSVAGKEDNGSTTGIVVDDGTVTGVAIESRAGSVADVRIVDSMVADLGTGVRLAGPNGSVSGVRVVGSDFSGNDRGIDVSDGAVQSVAVKGSDLVANDVGLLVRAPVDASALSLRGNRFADNDVGLWSRATGTIDAERNHWGAPSGPDAAGNPEGDGDVVRGSVDVDPWRPPVLRLENAAVSGDRMTVELVAHAERVAEYEVAVGYEPARVDDVSVEGGAMPPTLEVGGDALVVSGCTEEAVKGPVVLARVAFEGDLEAVADSLELRGERSVAYDGKGRALEAAFLTGDLAVDVEDDDREGSPGETPTEIPATETPTTEAPTTAPSTETPTPNGTAQATAEETPPATDAGSPTSTATDEAAGEDERRQAAVEAPNGEVQRSTDEPDPLGLETIEQRLSVVGETLSKLGELLRSLVGGAASQ